MSGRELAKELDRRKLTRRTLFMEGLTAKIREVLDGPAEKAKA